MVNDSLRRALADARLRDVDVAARLGVDPKTVQRWIAGRIPQARHRWGLADIVGRHEQDLWPLIGGVGTVNETVAVYQNRGAVPADVWRTLFASAREGIDILVYSGLFLVEDVGLMRLLTARATEGVRVRLAFGDPESTHVRSRGDEEGIDDALGAKVRSALVLCRPLLGTEGIEVRRHSTVLYNSLYRADGQVLVNAHIYGVGASRAPVLHLRHTGPGSMADTYRESFEHVWAGACPVS